MARRSHLKDVQEDAHMDMTPMIDVVFLLIIFFLCIDFKTLEAKLPAYLPKDRGSQTNPEEPVEQLSIKIVLDERGEEVVRNKKNLNNPFKKDGRHKHAYKLIGHTVHWEVGPKRYDDMTDLKSALTKIATDPQRRVRDKENPGNDKVMPVVIEPDVGSTYGDVAALVDVVTDSGFAEINFGGGRGAGGDKKN